MTGQPALVTKSLRADDLSPEDIQLYDKFVEEYLKDRDSTAAAARVGFAPTHAGYWGGELLKIGYVSKLIRDADYSELDLDKRSRLYLSWMEEHAMYKGHGSSHAARVSATKMLLDIATGEAAKRAVQEHIQGGVMIVPVVDSVEHWADDAARMQKQLKQEVAQ